MAAKAHLRNGKPLLIALCSNDALSANLKNIGVLMSRKNIFFAPMFQDDPDLKPASLICDLDMIMPAYELALAKKQIQPIFFS